MHRLQCSHPLRSGIKSCAENPLLGLQTRSASASAQLKVSRPPSSRKAQESSWNPDKVPKPLPPLQPRKMDGEVASMKKIFRALANNQVNVGYGWKTTPTLRGEEIKLRKAIAVTKSSRASLEREAFEAENEPMDENPIRQLDFAPGTFIETRRNEIQSFGIVLGEDYMDGRAVVRTLMTNGEIWRPIYEDILFFVPSIIPSDLAARCGSGDIAENEIERHARVEALRRLQSVVKIAEEAHMLLCTRGFFVYPKLADKDPTKWATVTVPDITRLLFNKPKLFNFFATHLYLMSDPLHFIPSSSYLSTQKVSVRPQRDVEEIKTIDDWKRIRDGPIQAFAAKAQLIIEENQQIHQLTREELPSQVPAKHTWTEDDKIIINFLLRSLRPYRTTQIDPYSLGQSAILKAVYTSLPRVGDDIAHKLLIDIGVIAPWQDLVVLQPDLELDLQPESKSTLVQQKNTILKRALSATTSPQVYGPEDLHLNDPLESIRHDFGDMPVYVIDDPGAHELDDAISVERIPSEPGNIWLHVHIADPASVLPRSHIFASSAKQQGETYYFKHRSWPLFPSYLMYHPVYGMSLGTNSKNGQPDRVLTFSAKLDAQGMILEHKVRAGLIRNVHLLQYDSVDLALGETQSEIFYPLGGKPPPATPANLTSEQMQDLQEIGRIAKTQGKIRNQKNVFTLNSNYPILTLNSKIPDSIISPTLEPAHFRGYPRITYGVTSPEGLDCGSKHMVAESMKIACRVASRFCTEHSLPALRRSSGVPKPIDEKALETLLSMRSPHGYVPFEQGMQYLERIDPAEYTLEPRGHFSLGVPDGEGYIRVTSPLRRFADLLTHWQIHHALLGERAVNRAAPFNEAYLEEYKVLLYEQERRRRNAEERHKKFWTIMQLQRWMEGMHTDATKRILEKEGLPNPFENIDAYVIKNARLSLSTRMHQADVWIPRFGIKALLTDLDSIQYTVSQSYLIKFSAMRLGVRPQLQVTLQ